MMMMMMMFTAHILNIVSLFLMHVSGQYWLLLLFQILISQSVTETVNNNNR